MPGAKSRLVALLLITVAVLLSGCVSRDDPLGSITASPGQYDYFDCPAIKVVAKQVVARRRELADLIARAERGPAGGLIATTTYRPEYVTLRGKMDELRRVAAEKHCNFDPATVQPDAPAPDKPAKRLPPPRRKAG